MNKNAPFVLTTCLLFVLIFSPAGMAEESITVTVATGAVGMEFDLTYETALLFMQEHPHIQIELVADVPHTVQDRLALFQQLFQVRSPEVDVYQIDVIWPGDLADFFVDLYEYGADAVVDDHFPAIVENNTVDGRLVGIPWFTDAGLLYYRTDLLEEYGFDPPATWKEFEKAVSAIQEGERARGHEDFWGFVWQGAAYEGLTCNALEWIYSNGGGTVVSPDGYITVNNPNALEAIEMAADWVGTISPHGVVGFAEEDSRAIFQAGDAAFLRNWPYVYAMANAPESPVQNRFDVSPLPAGKAGHGAATLGGWQLAVSRYSENPEVAAEVALYLASREAQKMRAIRGTLNPTIQDLYLDSEVLEAAPFFGDLYHVFINAVARPSTVSAPHYNEVSEIFFRGVHAVLLGERVVQDALDEIELDLVDLLGFPTASP